MDHQREGDRGAGGKKVKNFRTFRNNGKKKKRRGDSAQEERTRILQLGGVK